ncbi:MAG TPA: class I SAM-dependent methyltransferase [Candidatus Binatia bacterium]|jgi:SAM-dependent methyltransferase|nr:class I SAM-dependent methyltransferase [Candidatus Binatia bacterium]
MSEEPASYSYDREGERYAGIRRPDPRIARHVHDALGAARTVINVGAGAGSYEPEDRYVVAVEPSAVMRAQRPKHLAPALAGTADALPFDDGAFDAAMAMLTVHHWPDPAAGLRELRRVTSGPVVILTFDPEASTEFWMFDYAPEMADVERRRYVSPRIITAALGGTSELRPIPVPHDCVDRFQVALYARPEAFLDSEVRRAQSAWTFLPPGVEDRVMQSLADDLESGAWDRRYGALRAKPFIDCQLRLIVARR